MFYETVRLALISDCGKRNNGKLSAGCGLKPPQPGFQIARLGRLEQAGEVVHVTHRLGRKQGIDAATLALQASPTDRQSKLKHRHECGSFGSCHRQSVSRCWLVHYLPSCWAPRRSVLAARVCLLHSPPAVRRSAPLRYASPFRTPNHARPRRQALASSPCLTTETVCSPAWRPAHAVRAHGRPHWTPCSPAFVGPSPVIPGSHSGLRLCETPSICSSESSTASLPDHQTAGSLPRSSGR